jgi:glycosyltransferase involved in cell wall biosynthesis
VPGSQSGQTAALASGPILFDLTASLAVRGSPTGIARVEMELYRTLRREAPGRIRPIAWHAATGSFLALPPGQEAVPLSPDELAEMLQRQEATEVGAALISPGGQILVVGGTWARRSVYLTALARLRSDHSLPLNVVVHDLAQMMLKPLYPRTAEKFERNAQRLMRIADRFLLFSQATRTDLTEAVARAGLPAKPVGMFRLGTTFHSPPGTSAADGEAPPPLHAISGRPFVLFVSSVEPRKNHRMIVAAWRRLVAERGEGAPTLLLVGRPVMDGQRLIDEVRGDPVLSRHVHFATGLSDDELDWCYRNAAFTVYPSLYEGWGLPISESLLYGKFCITSNRSSMAEIAPELTELLNPEDAEIWSERVAFYLDHPDALAAREARIRNEYAVYGWEQSAREVLDVLRTLPPMLSSGPDEARPRKRPLWLLRRIVRKLLVRGRSRP